MTVPTILFVLSAATAPDSPSVLLESAKALYRDARFSEAVLKLDSAIASMRAGDLAPVRAPLADAYLYLGLAHLGLNDRPAAFAAFKDLARLDPDRQLDPEVYAPKVRRLFEEARAEVRRESPPSAAPVAAPSASAPETPSRVKDRSRVWLAATAAGLAAGGVIVATRGGESASDILVSLTLNGASNGASFSCQGALLLRVGATNPTSRTVRVNRFNLLLQSSTVPCVSHPAPVFGDSLHVQELAPHATDVEVRSVDLAGDLCSPPNGSPDGCNWQANVVLQTDIGNFGRDLQFSTTP